MVDEVQQGGQSFRYLEIQNLTIIEMPKEHFELQELRK
jgi:hypothetical protein